MEHLDIVGASLGVLRGAGTVKPKAPSAILVRADQVVTMGKDYNARNPKHRVMDLDVLPDTEEDAIVLDGAPSIKKPNDNQGGVTKKAKLDTAAAPKICADSEVPLVRHAPPNNDNDDDDWMHIMGMDVDPISFMHSPVVKSVGFYALQETPTWISLNIVANDATLDFPYKIQKIISATDVTMLLLPPMPAGVVSLVLNGTSHHITVLSEKTTNIVKAEMQSSN